MGNWESNEFFPSSSPVHPLDVPAADDEKVPLLDPVHKVLPGPVRVIADEDEGDSVLAVLLAVHVHRLEEVAGAERDHALLALEGLQ